MSIRKNVARAAGIGAAATIALGMLSNGAANADTFIPLPGGEVTDTLEDGTVVTVRIVGESANINPAMSAQPLARNVWVNGRTEVELKGANAKGGSIYPGYIVGCQINISSGGGTAGGGASENLDGKSGSVNGSLGGTLSLGPGQAKQFQLLDKEEADDFGNETHKGRNKFTGLHGSVTWAGAQLGVNGCAGYAEARAFIKVKVETTTSIEIVTLWGQPFSMG